MTDDELITVYLEHLRWCNRAQTTIEIRRTYLTKLSRDLGPLDKIKAKRLRKWLADPQRDLEASSQGVLLSAFHSFYDWCPLCQDDRPCHHSSAKLCGHKLAGNNGPIVGSRAKVERAMP